MSRLIQYINESKGEVIDATPEYQAKFIKRDCQYYLNLTKSTGPFNRAINENISQDEILKKKTREDRRSKGMNQEAHKEFNEWLEKNGHVRRDKSVSALSDSVPGVIFGTNYYFFPIGKFNYTWVKTRDINGIDPKNKWDGIEVQKFFDFTDYENEKEERKKRKAFPKFFTTNNGIEKAFKKKFEIWFDCKEYYLVNKKNNVFGKKG